MEIPSPSAQKKADFWFAVDSVATRQLVFEKSEEQGWPAIDEISTWDAFGPLF